MSAAPKRLRIVGPAAAFRAMWQWLAMNSPIPVTFQPAKRARSAVVIRIETQRRKRSG